MPVANPLSASADPGQEATAAGLLEQGLALEQLGQPDDALQHYEAALRLIPTLARAHFLRGTILLDRGDAADALPAFQEALRYKPDSAGAHFNLGAAHARLGRHEEAAAAYRRALALKPAFAEAEVALAASLEELGQSEEAIAAYRRALVLEENHAEAQNKLAHLLVRLDRFDEAAVCFRQILARNPHQVDALNSLGLILTLRGQLQDAVRQFRLAIQIKPDFLAAHGNLGNALMDLHQFKDAAESYRRVLELNPQSADAHNNLGTTFKDLGQLDKALASYRTAMELNPQLAVAHSNLLMVQNYLSAQPPHELLAEARRFGAAVSRLALADQPIPPPASAAWKNSPVRDRCLRVGMVSADLSAHPVGYFVESVLAALATQASGRLEMFAYSNTLATDTVTARIQSHLKGWHCVADDSDASLVDRIQNDQIDILIDLSGHTGGNRLPVFARRAAPVQISWLGYFATTGVQAIDYLIADPWTLPEALECQFTEKILRLPETRLCFTAPTLDVKVTPLPAAVNGYLTFACFNALPKMNDAVVALWARVLHGVPGSRLHLIAPQLSEPSTRDETLRRFIAHGIAAERLIIHGPVPRDQYLATYQRVDIALDPFPYTGGTTTVEALWMGVPVLTLAGTTFLARQGVGFLMNAGLPEWISGSEDDYVQRAIAHASNLPALARLRAGLRSQVLASPVFDAPRFARHFEAGLRDVWQQWCEQHPGSRAAAHPEDH